MHNYTSDITTPIHCFQSIKNLNFKVNFMNLEVSIRVSARILNISNHKL